MTDTPKPPAQNTARPDALIAALTEAAGATKDHTGERAAGATAEPQPEAPPSFRTPSAHQAAVDRAAGALLRLCTVTGDAPGDTLDAALEALRTAAVFAGATDEDFVVAGVTLTAAGLAAAAADKAHLTELTLEACSDLATAAVDHFHAL